MAEPVVDGNEDRGVSRLCALQVTHRLSVPVAGGVVAESADVLGLEPGARSRLRSVVQEVIESIIADSFPGDADVDLVVRVERRPGGMAVVIEDRGAPSSMSRGSYPARIAELIRLGFADDFSARYEGRLGNRTELVKNLPYASLAGDESFAASALADDGVEVGEDGQPAFEVRPMTPDDVLGVARLFYRCYGYTSAVSGAVYEPQRLAEYVRSGRHLATLAVTPSGRVVGHVASHVERPGATVGRIGQLVVDPAYRQLHLSSHLAAAHAALLEGLGFVGQYTDAVTVHPRSQALGLHRGYHETGLLLGKHQASMEMVGFEEGSGTRRSVMMMFDHRAQIPQRTSYVPLAYLDVVERIYAECSLPRVVTAPSRRGLEDGPASSRFAVQLRSEESVAVITVEEYGRDFDTALLSHLQELRLNRFDVTWLFLPLSRPETGLFGDGLQELGLSFGGVYPEYEDGDVLVLQSLNNVDIDTDAICTASPHGEFVRDFVVSDYRRALESSARLMRSRAQMARYYEALR